MLDNFEHFWREVELSYSKAKSYSDFNSFSKTKDSLKQYAELNASNVEVKDPNAILNILDQLTDKKYNNMSETGKSIRDIL